MKWKPAAEGHNTSQLVLAGQGGIQGQGPTLRETAKYYTVWRDPISGLVLDYGLDVFCCLLDSRFVLWRVGAETHEVKPRGHHRLHVECNGNGGRVGADKLDVRQPDPRQSIRPPMP